MSALRRLSAIEGRPELVLVAGLLVLYAVIMAIKLSLWHANVLCNDWAFYNNNLWNTNFRDTWLLSHDRLIQFGYKSYLNEHFGPLLIPLAALYQILPQGELLLLFLHGACPILAALGIYATAGHLLGDRRLAMMIAFVYALSPGILWPTISMVYGFEPDSMLAPMAAWAAYALATRRVGLFFVCFGLALSVKENVPAYGVILGVCLLLFTRRRLQAVALIALSVAVFLLASRGIPAITGVENRNVGVAFKLLGDLLHFRATFDYTWPELVVFVGYSMLFLPMLTIWPFLAMIGPDALAVGQVSYAKTVTWHVFLPITVMAAAAAFGSARFLVLSTWPSRLDAWAPRAVQLRWFWRAALVASIIAGPATLFIAYDRFIALASPVDQAAVADVRAQIPLHAGVAVTSDLEQYFTRRPIYSARPDVMVTAPQKFQYFVVNRLSLTPARKNGSLASSTRLDSCIIATAEQAVRDGARVVLDRGGILAVQVDRLPKIICP